MVPDTSVWYSGSGCDTVAHYTQITSQQQNKPVCWTNKQSQAKLPVLLWGQWWGSRATVTCVKCLRCPLMGGGFGSRWLCCICKMPPVSTDGFTTAQGGWGSRWLSCICKMFQVSTDTFTTAQGSWGSRWLCCICEMPQVSTDGFTTAPGGGVAGGCATPVKCLRCPLMGHQCTAGGCSTPVKCLRCSQMGHQCIAGGCATPVKCIRSPLKGSPLHKGRCWH